MTTLASSPLLVSMVQASTSLPLFVLALPAGAFADVFDRRRLLLVTQGWVLVAAACLAMLTAAGITGPVTPNIEIPTGGDRGPALITLGYQINSSEKTNFRRVMHVIRVT